MGRPTWRLENGPLPFKSARYRPWSKGNTANCRAVMSAGAEPAASGAYNG